MKKSSFVEGTILATIAIIIVKILGMLYVIPFYAMIGIQAGALYAYAYNIYVIFLDISTAGIPIAISKLVSEYQTLGMMEAKKRVYKIGLSIISLISVICFILLFLFAPQVSSLLLGDLTGGNSISDVTLVIRIVSFALLVIPFLSVTKGYLQGHKVINISSISQVIEQVVRIGVILLGVYLAIYIFDIEMSWTVGIAISGAFFGGLVAYLYVLRKIKSNKEELGLVEYEVKDEVTNKDIAKKIMSYAIPFIIINAVFSLYNFVDMVFILRTLDSLGFSAIDAEFITSAITTWSGKISMIVSSIAMGMTISLIPIIVEAFTKKNFEDVNIKLNQALQMLLLISLPMSIGISLLSKPIWSIFYGLDGGYGPMILSITIFVTLVGNIYMITSSTLQSLNKFKLVYKAAILGLLINLALDIPLMLFFNLFDLAPLGTPSASIIGLSFSFIYILYSLKKEHQLTYKKSEKLLGNLIVPIVLMIVVVLITKVVVPVDYDSLLSTIIYVGVCSLTGGLVYLVYIIKTGIAKRVLGERLFNNLLKKLTFGKFGN